MKKVCLVLLLATSLNTHAILNPRTAQTWHRAFAQHLQNYEETESLSAAYKAAVQAAKFEDAGDSATARTLLEKLSQAMYGSPTEYHDTTARELKKQFKTDIRRGVTTLARTKPKRVYSLHDALRIAQQAAGYEESSVTGDHELAEKLMEQLSVAVTGKSDYYHTRGWSAHTVVKQYERALGKGKSVVVYDGTRDATSAE